MSVRSRIPIGKDYPYMNARVSARRAKLLERQDYEDLSRMQLNEIANRLSNGDYGEEIEELGSEYKGAELIELAVNRNLAKTMKNLVEISPGGLEHILKTYLRKYDIETLKRILRWKRNEKSEEIQSLMTPVTNFGFEDIESMMEMEYDELVDSISFTDSEVDYASFVRKAETLRDVEEALDRAFYQEMQNLVRKTRSRGFSTFVEKEIEEENLRSALRLKKSDAGENEIRERMISQPSRSVEGVIESDDWEEAMEKIREENGINQAGNLEEFEHQMKKKRLEEALEMLHTEPLGATAVLGYVVAKVIEAENLKTLAQAKQNEFSQEEIMNALVIP